jgi:hypothetical protein
MKSAVYLIIAKAWVTIMDVFVPLQLSWWVVLRGIWCRLQMNINFIQVMNVKVKDKSPHSEFTIVIFHCINNFHPPSQLLAFFNPFTVYYIGVLISLWLFLFPIFLFAAESKEFFLDGLKTLQQQRHKCVELRGEYVNTFFQSHSFLFSL